METAGAEEGLRLQTRERSRRRMKTVKKGENCVTCGHHLSPSVTRSERPVMNEGEGLGFSILAGTR